jgi:hypothetical protein
VLQFQNQVHVVLHSSGLFCWLAICSGWCLQGIRNNLGCVTIFCGVHGSIGTCFVELNRVNVLDVVENLASVGGVSREWMLLFVVSSKILVMII